MFWLHCNACLTAPSSSSLERFFLSNCGHSFCSRCVHKSGGNNGCCPSCRSKPVRYVQLGSDMKPDVQKMFKDPGQEIMKVFKALEYQKAQSLNLVGLLKKKIGILEKERRQYQEALKRYQSENERLRDQLRRTQEKQRRQEEDPPFLIQPSPVLFPNSRPNDSGLSLLDRKKTSNRVTSGRLSLSNSLTSPPVTRDMVISSTPHLAPQQDMMMMMNSGGGDPRRQEPTFADMNVNAFETPAVFRRGGKPPPQHQQQPPQTASLLQKMSGWIHK